MSEQPLAYGLPPRVHVGVFTPDDRALLQKALRIANTSAALYVAERCCPTSTSDGMRWLDTRPMLDPRERSGAAIDLATEYLQYLLDAGIATRHATEPHMVRLQWPGRSG